MYAETLSTRFWQRDREEGCLRQEQDQRDNRRGGINVELGAEQSLPEWYGLGGEVRANGRPDAETYREGDTHMGEGLCAVGGCGDVGEDRACFFCPTHTKVSHRQPANPDVLKG